MGIFDYFSKDSSDSRKRGRALKKLTNMYYQQADRMASADIVYELAEAGDEAAVRVLLARFDHLCPSTTVDREEKDYVVGLLVRLGEQVVDPITEYCRKTTKTIYWPLRVLEQLWSEEMVADFIAEILEDTDTDYWREPEKKVGLMQAAASHPTERITRALVPFVGDHHEDVRFAAVDTLLGCDLDVREALIQRISSTEESLRMRQRIARGLVDKGWDLGEHASTVATHLAPGFAVKGRKVVSTSEA